YRARGRVGVAAAGPGSAGVARHTARVGIAAAIQQKILVLHVSKSLRIKGHADEVKVGIKTMNLDGNINVVAGRGVTVVVGVLVRGSSRNAGIYSGERIHLLNGAVVDAWQGRRAEDVLGRLASQSGVAGGRQISVVQLERTVETGTHRHSVLARTHVELSNHPHLQVFRGRDVAVVEISSGIGSHVVIGRAAADVDRPSRVRHAVIERRGVGI